MTFLFNETWPGGSWCFWIASWSWFEPLKAWIIVEKYKDCCVFWRKGIMPWLNGLMYIYIFQTEGMWTGCCYICTNSFKDIFSVNPRLVPSEYKSSFIINPLSPTPASVCISKTCKGIQFEERVAEGVTLSNLSSGSSKFRSIHLFGVPWK